VQARARVQDVRAGRALLACDVAADTCGACAARRGCALRWLAGTGKSILDVAETSQDGPALRPGDGVIVEVDDGELLRAAALAYVPPVAGLLAAPLVVAALLPGSEPAVLAGAVLGLVAGWGAARALLRRLPPRYRLRMAEAA
jgi:sigma-E factor negative regulatory protein RseC